MRHFEWFLNNVITANVDFCEVLSGFEGKDDIVGKGNKLSTRSNDGIELG